MLAVAASVLPPAATDHIRRYSSMGNPANTPTVTKPPCSVESCPLPSKTRGWCNIHYQRWMRHGDPTAGEPMRKPSRPRGMLHADVVARELRRSVADGTCMISVASRASHGYPHIGFEGKTVSVHRMVLEDKLGRRLLADEVARHLCHRPDCINPDHLDVGSYQDNTDDMLRAGRQRHVRGIDHPRTKLTPDEVREIRKRYESGGVTYAQLASEYGVSYPQVLKIVRRQTWVHLP